MWFISLFCWYFCNKVITMMRKYSCCVILVTFVHTASYRCFSRTGRYVIKRCTFFLNGINTIQIVIKWFNCYSNDTKHLTDLDVLTFQFTKSIIIYKLDIALALTFLTQLISNVNDWGYDISLYLEHVESCQLNF